MINGRYVEISIFHENRECDEEGILLLIKTTLTNESITKIVKNIVSKLQSDWDFGGKDYSIIRNKLNDNYSYIEVIKELPIEKLEIKL